MIGQYVSPHNEVISHVNIREVTFIIFYSDTGLEQLPNDLKSISKLE